MHLFSNYLITSMVGVQARRMDVVWGETAGVKGQIMVLYPLLFILQVQFLQCTREIPKLVTSMDFCRLKQQTVH